MRELGLGLGPGERRGLPYKKIGVLVMPLGVKKADSVPPRVFSY